EDRATKLQATANPKISAQIIQESTEIKASISIIYHRFQD
ncbi:hypothetical protein EAI_01342, partial [Harpegnathos saltator]